MFIADILSINIIKAIAYTIIRQGYYLYRSMAKPLTLTYEKGTYI